MHRVSLKTLTPGDIWEKSKRNLRRYNPSLDFNWESIVPGNLEASFLLNERWRLWHSPKRSVVANKEILNRTLENLIPRIEGIFQADLSPVSMQVLDTDEYCQITQECEKETKRAAGFGDTPEFPACAYLFPYQRKIFFPENFLAVSKHATKSPLIPSRYEVSQMPWDKGFFDLILCHLVSAAMFIQIRGEWGEDYIKSIKSLGKKKLNEIISVKNTIGQRVIERISEESNGSFAFYGVADQILNVWAQDEMVGKYLIIDALSKDHTLAQISCLDQISYDGLLGPVIGFYHNHPSYQEKRKRYERRQEQVKPN